MRFNVSTFLILEKSLFESNKNKGKLLHPNKFIIGFYSKENIDQYP
jgi:hypothetical protein